MEYEKIKKLMDDMGDSKLTSIDIDFPDGTKISMKKEKQVVVEKGNLGEVYYNVETTDSNNLKNEGFDSSNLQDEGHYSDSLKTANANYNSNMKNASSSNVECENELTEEDDGNIVKSPMVGTFYIKPSPDAKPYVELGDEVNKGDTLCIIEAMKLMNDIQSEYTGKITKIYVQDGEPVEYGTKLFKIE